MNFELSKIYDFTGKSVVITGGAGVICSRIARTLYDCGANVTLLDVNHHLAQQSVKDMSTNNQGNKAMAIHCNVLDVQSVQEAISQVIDEYGKIDALINGAGGNNSEATTNEEQPFFPFRLKPLNGCLI